MNSTRPENRETQLRPPGLGQRLLLLGLATAALLLAGCARPLNNAPVEERGTGLNRPSATAGDAQKILPGSENAGKPGYYTVKPGDTLIRIGLENGQNFRDVVRWNGLADANLIEVGQVLRVVPPGNDSQGAVTRPAAAGTAASGSAAASGPRPAVSAAASTAHAATAPTASSGGDEDVGWIWPAQGAVIAGFDDAKNKGVDIGGKAGDAVVASADGRVVYAGAGLRGYGNLIILKHNNTFLTAYAHNQTLLVKEDQTVKKGQKIAEMGNSDADRVKLHFEIRRQGKPVDPAKYLPAK